MYKPLTLELKEPEVVPWRIFARMGAKGIFAVRDDAITPAIDPDETRWTDLASRPLLLGGCTSEEAAKAETEPNPAFAALDLSLTVFLISRTFLPAAVLLLPARSTD